MVPVADRAHQHALQNANEALSAGPVAMRTALDELQAWVDRHPEGDAHLVQLAQAKITVLRHALTRDAAAAV